MKSKIIVVTHKDYEMPKDSVYFPICVGGVYRNSLIGFSQTMLERISVIRTVHTVN